MSAIKIEITGWLDLEPEEVWPNGNAPAEITAEAVRDAMQAYGGKVFTLTDWEFLDALQVHVWPARGGSAEVWATGWRAAQFDGDADAR